MTTKTEKWLPIDNIGNLYNISDRGRIMSFAKHARGKIIKPCMNGRGQLYYRLCLGNGEKKNFFVHRLVAEAFVPNPNGLKQVHHINNDMDDNNATNLEWVSDARKFKRKRDLGLPKPEIIMKAKISNIINEMISWEYYLVKNPGQRKAISRENALNLISERGLVEALRNSDGVIWDTPDRAFKNKYAIEADKKINDMDVEDIGEESIEHNSQHKGN